MKRSIKNIIMILLVVLLVGSIIFTMNYAKDHVTSSDNNTSMMQGGTPPDMPNDNYSTSADSQDSNSNSTSQNNNGGTPPEKPDGDSSSDTNNSSNNGGTPPEIPSGSNNGGTPPDIPNGNSISASLSVIYYVIFGVEALLLSIIIMYLIMSRFNRKSFSETMFSTDKKVIYVLGLIILTGACTFGSGYITNNYLLDSNFKSNNMMNGGSSTASYSSENEITEDTTITSGSYSSTTKDENAILVNGDIDVNISGVTVTKSGDSDGGDNTSFYGTNSAITAKSGANLVLKNINVETNATGANGVFSYGGSATTNNSSSDGTTITISDSTITTTKDNSGGIMTTGGGVMNASNLTINTAGISSAAIRSDRGGGVVNVDGGTYKTTGQGSPTIYSTADITVKNAKLVATASEGVVIEGNNSVTLENVVLEDNNNKLNGQSTTYKNIFLYQSMSGDAANGNSTFTAKNSIIKTNKGDTLYVTNTTSTINLENNKITNTDSSGNFLRAQADSWGNSGSNGGDVTLVMTNQKAKGNIVIDSVSTLDMTMKDNSYYVGCINKDNSAKSIKLTLDKTSKIKLTGDSYVTSLDDADSSYSNIDFNGYKLYVNGKAIN